MLHVKSDKAHTGAVSLQWMTSSVCAAVVSYSSAPLTGDHMISRVSVDTRFILTSCGQQGTGGEEGRRNAKMGENINQHCAKDHADGFTCFNFIFYLQAAIIFTNVSSTTFFFYKDTGVTSNNDLVQCILESCQSA